MSTAAKELPACPVETTLTLIGDKWKVLILRDLMPGIKRFGELRKSVGDVSHRRCSPPSCGIWSKTAWSTGYGKLSISDVMRS